MNKEPVDKYFGIPISEWIDRTPNELSVDAVGLWQIIPVGKDSFDLDGEELVDFVRRSIVALMLRGAVPVIPAPPENGYWIKQLQYGENADDVANHIIAEWHESAADPDENGVWFALMD